MAESQLRKIMVRSVVGVLMLLFFGFMMNQDHIWFTIVLIVGQIITWKEVVSIRYNDVKENNLPGFRTLNWYWLFVAFYFFYGKRFLILSPGWVKALAAQGITLPFDSNETTATLLKYHPAIVFGLYLIALIFFVWSLREAELKYQIAQIAWTIVCLLLVVGQSHFVIQYLYEGFIWVVVPHGLIMVNDIMAYYCGMALGKKIIARPLTQLSPNKTWEGFLGAMFCTVAFAFYVTPKFIQNEWLICPSGLFNNETGVCLQRLSVFQTTSYDVPEQYASLIGTFCEVVNGKINIYPFQLHAIVFALFASLIAPFGGFLASGIKRAYQIKDYASLFPGHGGFMDRVDCQFMMASFVFVYLITFILPPDYSILNQISALPIEEQQALLSKLSQSLGQSPNIV